MVLLYIFNYLGNIFKHYKISILSIRVPVINKTDKCLDLMDLRSIILICFSFLKCDGN